jgi:hypothetical protein
MLNNEQLTETINTLRAEASGHIERNRVGPRAAEIERVILIYDDWANKKSNNRNECFLITNNNQSV